MDISRRNVQGADTRLIKWADAQLVNVSLTIVPNQADLHEGKWPYEIGGGGGLTPSNTEGLSPRRAVFVSCTGGLHELQAENSASENWPAGRTTGLGCIE